MMLRRLLIGVLLLGAGGGVHAQGTWDAILTVDPYPTPYYSDWDSNPNIASLTLINSTGEAQSVRIHFSVINHANRVVVSGTSSPELIAAGATVIYDNPYDVAGSTTHDRDMEEIAARTGRMPEGDYTACATATDGSGFVLAEACATFSIVYPDPPLLLGPMDGDVLEQGDPLFTWTPVQVPLDYQLSYVVRLAEVQSHQSAPAALRENIPHFETVENAFTSLRYPLDAQPLESGKTYAWSVQVLDQNGYAAAANEGRSEIWTFRYTDDIAVHPQSPTDEFDVSIGFYDAENDDPPELLRLIATGASFDEFMSYVMKQIRDGHLVIPLPAPALAAALLPAGGAGVHELDPYGGAVGAASAPPSQAAPAAACSNELRWPSAQKYTEEKKFVVSVRFEGALIQGLFECLGVEGMRPPNQRFELMFAANFEQPLPRVVVGIKPTVPDIFDNLDLTYAVFLLNPLGEFRVDASFVPADFAGFFLGHEIDIWGPGVGEVLGRFAQTYRDTASWGKKARNLGSLIGVNFYGVLQLNGPVRAFANQVGVVDPTLTLRGFVGSREKTYRGISGWARSPLKMRDNWYLLGSLPLSPPTWMGATSRRFELEFGSQDTSTAAVPLFGPADMITRYRIVLRDVLGGFPALKQRLRIPADSTLEFFSEYKVEWTGGRTLAEPVLVESSDPRDVPRLRPTSNVSDTSSIWSRTQMTVTYGTHAQLDLFNGWLNLFDPKLIIGRKDHSQPIMSNPLKNGWVFLGSDIGVGGHRVGNIDFQFSTGPETPPPDTSRAKLEAYAKLVRLKARADSLEDRYWMMNEQLSTEIARLPADDPAAYEHAIRNDEMLRVLMAEVHGLKQQMDRARSEYDTESRKDPTAMPKTKLSVQFTARLEQGMSVVALLKLAGDLVKELRQ